MKKKLVLALVTIVSTCFLGYFLLRFASTSALEYTLVNSKKKIKDADVFQAIIGNEKEIDLCINRYRLNSQDSFFLMTQDYNFDKFDYLISNNVDIKQITFNSLFNISNDLCPELNRIPLKIEVGNSHGEILVYTINDKGKYRIVCP